MERATSFTRHSLARPRHASLVRHVRCRWARQQRLAAGGIASRRRAASGIMYRCRSAHPADVRRAGKWAARARRGGSRRETPPRRGFADDQPQGSIADGRGGIRTHGTLSRTHTFQACALNHSATRPTTALRAQRGVSRAGHTGSITGCHDFTRSTRHSARSDLDGQGEIRTHDTVAGMPVFETGAFNHSATCPAGVSLAGADEHVNAASPIQNELRSRASAGGREPGAVGGRCFVVRAFCARFGSHFTERPCAIGEFLPCSCVRSTF